MIVYNDDTVPVPNMFQLCLIEFTTSLTSSPISDIARNNDRPPRRTVLTGPPPPSSPTDGDTLTDDESLPDDFRRRQQASLTEGTASEPNLLFHALQLAVDCRMIYGNSCLTSGKHGSGPGYRSKLPVFFQFQAWLWCNSAVTARKINVNISSSIQLILYRC